MWARLSASMYKCEHIAGNMKGDTVIMRASVVAVGAVVIVGAVAASLVWHGLSAHRSDGLAVAGSPGPLLASNASQPQKQESTNAELLGRLRTLCDRAGGSVGVAVIHVETGRSAAFQGETQLPLYSVFKLPLAVAVLKGVEENRLRLDQKVRVAPADVVPGWKGNSDLWRRPVERTVAELLELSIVRSDNTSSDKLLQLVGGPDVVTQRMRSFGLSGIDIRYPVREFAAHRDKPNTGAASDLARLLAQLQKGEVLQPSQLALLLGLMGRATTGERRLRGDLPAGTPVADKTGTGEPGSSTNDVGLITLPGEKGHLAMAVLLSGSKLPAEAQEKLIAELARAAYDAYVSRAASGAQ
jgi:beta-lactamase class A